MDIQAKLQRAEQRYQEKQTERDKHLKDAEECLTEMVKLQGEYRVLQELLESDKPEANKQAEVIEAVPEKKDKK